MDQTPYALRVTVPVAYEAALRHTTDALKAEGFGVLTTIDVQQTLRAKLNQAFRKYVILGACNPLLAERALRAEVEVGLLLPCNVIVYEAGPHASVVSALAPLAALGIVGSNVTLQAVATEADERLRRVLAAVVQTSGDHRPDRHPDQDLHKGAIEGNRPTDEQQGNPHGQGLDANGLPNDPTATAEDVVGANADQTQG